MSTPTHALFVRHADSDQAGCGVAVIPYIPTVHFLAILFWALGPDCGVVAAGAIRQRYVAVALGLGLTTASLPVTIAGRRAVAFLGSEIPVAVLTLLGLMTAASNEPGWRMF